MALASPPGSENPSQAFLAGQQHGQKLAVQHATSPPPAKATKPAAPTRKVAAPAQTLLQQAQAIAQAQTDAQVNAIKAQQAEYQKQALDRAQQIQAASQASAGILNGWNLGGTTASSYDQAAKTIAGLAQGFSGQTGADATSAANAVQANLANLGAPATGAKTPTGQVSDPAALQNVLYGVGGFIPANLLETSGQAAAAVQRSLPASVLAQGQSQAAGTVAAGNTQADSLTPQLLDAQGKLPTLVQQALAGLSAQQQQQFTNRLAIAKYQTGISEFNANQKISVAKLGLESQRIAQSQFNSDRSYQISLANLGISQANLQLKITQNAFKAAHGGYSATAIKKFDLQANSIANAGYHGTTSTTVDKNGNPTTTTKGSGQPYFQVLGQMMKRGIPVQNALAALDRVYPANLRPSDEALQKELGPLTPSAILQQVNVNAGTPGVAATAITNPTSLLTHAGGFVPANVSFTTGRADQGRDIQTTPGTPIIAPGAGVVVAVKSDPGGGGAHFGPSYPVVHFTSGPYAGQTIYIGHTTAALKPGQQFSAGATLSFTGHGGPESGGAPPGWAEIGYAPGGTPGGFGQKTPF